LVTTCDRFVVVYLDDILIYSQTEEEHKEHVRLVLEKLRQWALKAKLSKCQFGRDSVEFLGHLITKDGTAVTKSSSGCSQGVDSSLRP
jgi:hypothetical protein